MTVLLLLLAARAAWAAQSYSWWKNEAGRALAYGALAGLAALALVTLGLVLRAWRERRRQAAEAEWDPPIVFPTPRQPALAEAIAASASAGAPRAPAAPAWPEPQVVEGQTIRFYRSDGVVQLLPGWLEVIAGEDRGQEIRFVRTAPGPTAEITFGRGEGPPLRHIQLHAGTVSRLHARMRFEGGRWEIANLSATNPVLVNGIELFAAGMTHPLRDGDRIEMGELVFQFHQAPP